MDACSGRSSWWFWDYFLKTRRKQGIVYRGTASNIRGKVSRTFDQSGTRPCCSDFVKTMVKFQKVLFSMLCTLRYLVFLFSDIEVGEPRKQMLKWIVVFDFGISANS
mmetsp:Transcript_20883/g.44339  ORF Transcript_20883/g.44339 Transcript_20883/m.44339 type:complete len:107 (-) Transcript_20883:296-616(-)